jgi:hypothetical protein
MDGMLPHIGATLRAAREGTQPRLTRETVAVKVGCSLDKIRNLEGGRAWPRSPGDADEMVCAYAELTGTEPFVLWEIALEVWREDAGLESTPASRVQAMAVRAALRTKQARDASREKPDATPKKQADG